MLVVCEYDDCCALVTGTEPHPRAGAGMECLWPVGGVIQLDAPMTPDCGVAGGCWCAGQLCRCCSAAVRGDMGGAAGQYVGGYGGTMVGMKPGWD